MRLLPAAGCLVALGVLSATAYAGQQGDDAGRDPVLASVVQPALVERAPAARPVSRDVGGTGPRVDPAWVRRTAAAAGIPEPAVAAYAGATLLVPTGCHLGWTTLAGIGWVESQHGTLGGRTVDSTGRSSTAILGPALDGRGPVAAIPATPGSTAWHGDGAWDHAVGPMQFIPSTWETWAADGDSDGVADPHDLDDASYAAARYLCEAGGDL
ncbi:MAG TPA: lytic murein transglycosylase, partial [Candidatus Nanopelagicales bacterium]|nr:lytic murein transglycosylase [Candidatus Nanopelagicales bacterium]